MNILNKKLQTIQERAAPVLERNDVEFAGIFGSYARGDYDAESDIDVLVVLKDYKQYGREIDRTGELICSMSLDYGVTVSPIFMRERDWVKGEKPLLQNVQAEGVPV